MVVMSEWEGKLDKGGQEILVNSSYKTTNLMYNLIRMINIAVCYI